MTHFNLLAAKGWGNARKDQEETHRSIPIPKNGTWLIKLLAFSGPGYLVAVGYMDPGNWATDLIGGSRFGYTLLSVILLSSLTAMLFQYLSAKLGIATGRDLAQICRDKFSPTVNFLLWIMCEIMIIACDLAEVIGSAIAINLLFHIPLLWGVIITGADVLLLLLLQKKGFRWLEALIITMITTIIVCFTIDLFLAQPIVRDVLNGFIPTKNILTDKTLLYIAIGIVGATIMPHNLYLHSSIVQTRNYEETDAGKKEAIKYTGFDTIIALTMAFFVNAAILAMSAAVFHTNGLTDVGDIADAHKLLSPLLGTTLASTLFALALLASGQNSTITGTLAGQIIMEGFLNLRIKPWLRRIITRGVALIPALIAIVIFGENSLTKLLILSQVVLSIQLPFALFPLVYFTAKKNIMGQFTNHKIVTTLATLASLTIATLNFLLLWGIATA